MKLDEVTKDEFVDTLKYPDRGGRYLKSRLEGLREKVAKAGGQIRQVSFVKNANRETMCMKFMVSLNDDVVPEDALKVIDKMIVSTYRDQSEIDQYRVATRNRAYDIWWQANEA